MTPAPSEAVMLVLHALCEMTDVMGTTTGDVIIEYDAPETWTGRNRIVMSVECQDELERRGWLALLVPDADGAPTIGVTGDGRRANGDWLRAREKANRKARRAG